MAKKQEANDNLPLLKAAIRDKNIGRLYVFHGEEVFLLHHYFNQLRKQLIDPLTESFNYHKFTAENFDIPEFADAVENLPMMAECTMTWVDDVDIFKMNEADRDKIADILGDIPDYCTVIFTYETAQWKPDKRMKKLWDAVEENGLVVEFVKQSQRDLIAWVTRHFAAEHKQISQELCAYLIDITGGTMTALKGEISKIAAFSGADAIVKSDIDAVTEPVLDAAVFQMTNMISDGRYGQALEKLHQLLKMQEDPLLILGAIGGHFRRMGTARTLLDYGRSASELMQLYNISDYAARKTMSAAGKFSASFYRKTAELLLETDRQMKTSYDTQERLLEMLILQIAQEARNG